MKARLCLTLLIIFFGGLFLNACCPTCAYPNCCPSAPTPRLCNLTIIANINSNVYGTVYINGKSTGQYIDFEYCPVIKITNLSCNQSLSVYIKDNFGCISHTENVWLSSIDQFLYFTYW